MSVFEFEFTPGNSIEIPGPRWVCRSDLSPCADCGCATFEVVAISRLIPANRGEPERWGEAATSVQCGDCSRENRLSNREYTKARKTVLGFIDMTTGIYTSIDERARSR